MNKNPEYTNIGSGVGGIETVVEKEGAAKERVAKKIAAVYEQSSALTHERGTYMEQLLQELEEKNHVLGTELRALYTKIVSLSQQIETEQDRMLEDIAREGIPFALLRKTFTEFQKEHKDRPGLGTKEDRETRRQLFSKDIQERHQEGDKKIESFIGGAKKPYNLLYLDRSLSPQQLKIRRDTLHDMYEIFKNASISDRNRLEKIIIEMLGVPEIPADVQDYLNEIGEHHGTITLVGAENENSIFIGGRTTPEVKIFKTSKDRHHYDFTSVLKLMRDMHACALRLNVNIPESGIRIRTVFEDMTIYRDRSGRNKRLVRQKYAHGTPVAALPEAIKADHSFRSAWRSFLGRVESMKETDGVVLDITNSKAGFKPARGNVNDTENVFVSLPTEKNPTYTFSIVDPDVFDAPKASTHKFDPKEHLRTRGLAGIGGALRMIATNRARDWPGLVRAWQDEAIQRELSDENKDKDG